jgi:CBS domain-containing protein
VLRALEQGGNNGTTVLNAGSHDLIVSFPDEILHEAAMKMLRNNVGRLPVVSRRNPHQIVGYLGRRSLMAAHLRRLEEEHVRERLFLRRPPETKIVA